MSFSSVDRGVPGESCVLPAMRSRTNLTKLFRNEEAGRDLEKLQREEGPVDNDEVVVRDDPDAVEEDGDEAAVFHGNTGESGKTDEAEMGRLGGDGANDKDEEEKRGPDVLRLLRSGGTSSRSRRMDRFVAKAREIKKRRAAANRNKAERQPICQRKTRIMSFTIDNKAIKIRNLGTTGVGIQGIQGGLGGAHPCTSILGFDGSFCMPAFRFFNTEMGLPRNFNTGQINVTRAAVSAARPLSSYLDDNHASQDQASIEDSAAPNQVIYGDHAEISLKDVYLLNSKVETAKDCHCAAYYETKFKEDASSHDQKMFKLRYANGHVELLMMEDATLKDSIYHLDKQLDLSANENAEEADKITEFEENGTLQCALKVNEIPVVDLIEKLVESEENVPSLQSKVASQSFRLGVKYAQLSSKHDYLRARIHASDPKLDKTVWELEHTKGRLQESTERVRDLELANYSLERDNVYLQRELEFSRQSKAYTIAGEAKLGEELTNAQSIRAFKDQMKEFFHVIQRTTCSTDTLLEKMKNHNKPRIRNLMNAKDELKKCRGPELGLGGEWIFVQHPGEGAL